MCKDFPIIIRLGGREAVISILREQGLDYGTLDAVRMWSAPSRRRIPGDAMRGLMKHCEGAGISYTSDDFALPDADSEVAA